MPDSPVPSNLEAYLHAKLAEVHASAQLVFVFDPAARLALAEALSVAGRTWAVFPYDGNDLSLRAAWRQAGSRVQRRLVWVTGRGAASGGERTELRLSSLADLLAAADDWFDLSISGVLATLIPHEVWPATALEQHAEILGENLPAVEEGHRQLRLHLKPGATLDASSARILALHASHPSIPVEDLLFRQDTPGQLLDRYMRLAWGAAWTAEMRALLRSHVQQSAPVALGNVAPWLDAPTDQLAAYLYLRRFLGRNRVPNIANQLRGVGVLGFDPEALEPRSLLRAYWTRSSPSSLRLPRASIPGQGLAACWTGT